MNESLFIEGYLSRIQRKFNLESAFAFEVLTLAAFLDLGFEEVMRHASTIIDGSGKHDGGMDGLYLDEDGDEASLHVFQVKSSPNVKENEISKFVADYRNLFVYDNPTRIPLNQKVSAILERFRGLVSSGRIVDTKLYFVYKGEKSKQSSELLERHMEGTDHLHIYDIHDLYRQIDSLISDSKKRKKINFSFMAEKSNIALRTDPQALISFAIQNVTAVNFRLKAIDLCQLLDDEETINKRIDTLFSENIRGFLGNNKTNRNIRNTLESDDAEYFPFLNNGITVIAERVKIPREMATGFFPIETTNPVIVNGLQTTHVIYETYKKDASKLDGVYVLVRLYETTDRDLIDKITDATNTQSPISYRDKISNRRFNEYTRTVFENAGIGYLNKRGATFENSLSAALEKSVHNETVLKFWYATFNEQPEVAKRSKSRVLEELFDATTNRHSRLHKLFCGDKDSLIYKQLLLAFEIYDFTVSQREAHNDLKDFVFQADEMIAYGIYKLMEKEGALFATTSLESYYNHTYDALARCISQEKKIKEENQMTYSHNSFFQSPKSRFMLNEALGVFEKPGPV